MPQTQKSKPTTSLQYLRQAAAQRRAKDRAFADRLNREKLEFENMCMMRIEEANRFMQQLGVLRQYRRIQTIDRGMRVLVSRPNSQKNEERIISLQMFLREHEKLKVLVDKTLQEGSGNTHVHKSASLGAQGEMKQHSLNAKAKVVNPKHKLTRTEAQAELQEVLEGTRRLTAILQEQLDEIQRRGWNAQLF